MEVFSDSSEEVEGVIEENENIDDDDDNILSSEENDISDEIEEELDRNIEVAGRTWKYIAQKQRKTRAADCIRKEKGLTEKSKDIESILDCFFLFISDEIFEIIVKFTNQRAKEIISKYNETHEDNLFKSWQDVDVTEIRGFFAILILSGRFREAKENPVNLWTSTNISLSRPIYQACMSRNRYCDILRFLRFDDISTRTERISLDKLAPIRDVVDNFTKNCRDSYCPSAFGTIDEQLVSYRGRCPFKVYIPSKPGKYGIKIWTLCDATTVYCCNLEVYLGKKGGSAEQNQGPRVVKTLANHWYGSGRNITTDNFFTDLTLAEERLKEKLTLIGTMRKNRKDLPKSLLDIKSRAVYSSDFLFTRDLTLVSYVTKPKKFVILLSSTHHEHDIADENEKFKPDIILAYNKTKSGVDVLDKLVREYSCKRNTRRWPLRLFLNLIDIACYNAFVLWTIKNPEWHSDSSITYRRKIFLQDLGMELARTQIERRVKKIEEDGRGFTNLVTTAIESTGRKIRKTCKDDTPSQGTKRGRCRICRGSDNKHSKRCDKCNQFVCSQHSQSITVKQTTCTYCAKDEDGEPS
ncbi:piggyBac transposable element-derived protein 4-like [Onthophagus taurus]|uniref:piggyBac transposable element-derived protein 4-like n=1 Tax=Onthophagus taurus TaxID=166361 RepID=UPI0039BE3423